MADLYPVADCKFYIGGVLATKNADFIAGDFSGETWVEVDGWSQMGTIGDTSALISAEIINRGRDVKQKGTKNSGSMENVFASQPTDAGQLAIIAAEKVSSNYAIKVEFNDGATTNSERLFIALIMNAEETGGPANTVRNLNTTMEVNSNIVHVAAV